MNLNLHHLNIFYNISKFNSITKAAKELNISQAAVSLQIKDFHEKCGIQFFEIIGKKIFLTQAGKAVYPKCEQLFSLKKEIEDIISGNQNAFSENVSVLATFPFSEYYFDKILLNINRKYPNIFIQLMSAKSSEIIKKVENMETDFGVVALKVKNSKLVVKPLIRDSLCVICHPDHPLSGKAVINPLDFENQNMIMHEISGTSRIVINEYTEMHNIKFNIIEEIDLIKPIIELIKNNLGISILSRHVAESYVTNRNPRIIPIKGGLYRHYYLIYHKEKYISSSLRQVFDEIEEWCGDYNKKAIKEMGITR